MARSRLCRHAVRQVCCLLLATAPAAAQLVRGDLMVANAQNADPSVVELTPLGVGQTVLTAADGLGSPRGLAIEPFTGDLFVADAAEQRIWRWDPTAGLSTFADASDGIGNPEGLTFDAAGDLFVSNAANATASVLRFDPGGNGTTILSLADGLGSPRGLAIDPTSGDLFVADALAQRVFRWNPSAGISTFADVSDGIGNPEGLAFDAVGNLFVSNAANATASVLRFDQEGNGITILSLADGLGSPRGLAVDPSSGDLFVADAQAQRVFRWNASAGLLTFADAGDGIGAAQGLAFVTAPVPVPALGPTAVAALAVLLALAGAALVRLRPC